MKNVNDNDIGLFPPESNNKIFINRSYLFDNILFISLKTTFLLLLRVILHYFFFRIRMFTRISFNESLIGGLNCCCVVTSSDYVLFGLNCHS